jgi:hypothetical protein
MVKAKSHRSRKTASRSKKGVWQTGAKWAKDAIHAITPGHKSKKRR